MHIYTVAYTYIVPLTTQLTPLIITLFFTILQIDIQLQNRLYWYCYHSTQPWRFWDSITADRVTTDQLAATTLATPVHKCYHIWPCSEGYTISILLTAIPLCWKYQHNRCWPGIPKAGLSVYECLTSALQPLSCIVNAGTLHQGGQVLPVANSCPLMLGAPISAHVSKIGLSVCKSLSDTNSDTRGSQLWCLVTFVHHLRNPIRNMQIFEIRNWVQIM